MAAALVRAVVIGVADELVEDGMSVALGVDQQPVGALLADGANEPSGSLPGASGERS